MKTRAKCFVPESHENFTWPEFFETLPRRGETVCPAEVEGSSLVVDKVVYKNHKTMDQPPTFETHIELHLLPPLLQS